MPNAAAEASLKTNPPAPLRYPNTEKGEGKPPEKSAAEISDDARFKTLTHVGMNQKAPVEGLNLGEAFPPDAVITAKQIRENGGDPADWLSVKAIELVK